MFSVQDRAELTAWGYFALGDVFAGGTYIGRRRRYEPLVSIKQEICPNHSINYSIMRRRVNFQYFSYIKKNISLTQLFGI